jgi:hypothetical protein
MENKGEYNISKSIENVYVTVKIPQSLYTRLPELIRDGGNLNDKLVEAIALRVHPDTGAITLFALRYCMGRMTYAPSMTIDWVKQNWGVINRNDRLTIKKDVADFVDSGRSLGMDCDAQTWLGFNSWLADQVVMDN